MTATKRLITSESVTEGHPDKICDQISDAILDAILKDDPDARVACETAVTTGLVLVMGEVTTSTYVDIQKIVRKTVKDIGYDRGKYGFDAETMGVLVAIDPQSPDIAQGVDKNNGQGAGDQGIMFGYASNETDEFMPATIVYAHKLARRLSHVRKNGPLTYLRPDGKTQITLEFNDENRPVRADSIVVSAQHAKNIRQDQIHKDIREHVIEAVVPARLIDENTKIHINPTGKFVVGGPHGDAGVTGRKTIVDTYGGAARHGGGAFSGKDPTKVDRSASYAARHIAKNVVAAGLADRIEVQLSYVIGVEDPSSVSIETFGTAHIDEKVILAAVLDTFDLRPEAIIKTLDLRRPLYLQTASYGHFGRLDLDLPWERTDRVEPLKSAVEKHSR